MAVQKPLKDFSALLHFVYKISSIENSSKQEQTHSELMLLCSKQLDICDNGFCS